MLSGVQLEVTDCYQYLGIKLRPSGSLSFAAEELSAKARKAWYSISSLVYKDKRMSVSRAFQLFDSLVTPVALYACEFWLPFVLPKKSFNSKTSLLSAWDGLKCETINQQCARMIFSVHRKASRLAVLGDLGRYPLAIKAMAQTLSYRQCLLSKPADSPIGLAMAEMRDMAKKGTDCWLTRTNKMADLLNVPSGQYCNSKFSSRPILKSIKGSFDRYWIDEISSSRVGKDGEPHNKLLSYSSFKSSFTVEPYLLLVQNRNQRCHLSRLRVSAHRLGCEILRYRQPPVPRSQRFCKYCPPVPGAGLQAAVRPVDDEVHCLTACVAGQGRAEMYNSISASNINFTNMCNINKFKTLVCSTTSYNCKIVSRFLKDQFRKRDEIDLGSV